MQLECFGLLMGINYLLSIVCSNFIFDNISYLINLRSGEEMDDHFIESLKRLTPRESEVLLLAMKGLSNREIGDVLSISSRTVEIHRAHIFSKTGCRSIISIINNFIEMNFWQLLLVNISSEYSDAYPHLIKEAVKMSYYIRAKISN